ncbi:DNA repair protein RecO [Kingella negevensis]|uniref:DNA repair protein RecO n=1 Tax=Kingella negevensis TaxID=1522312 RepID=UPI002550CEB7|nr:DNA repair protein RecO [Kingella negevensis]MDK4681035.1 DNA repair protein RecO [Kingella negevensis]MDK4683237.1 DNA repair protein RecO [Kingella negevensis]MDK4691631.1 DNA repair protein RecO [Kingella negevensis]MDK4693218.1 DNA repair protein RecO [Kingella negevensis]MDK4699518.1 DNA repair protein RecO [Kingella negevensis]
MSNRINHQPVFLLTSQPWRENSLRVEVFSRDYGRVSLLARSARTRGSELRGVLVPFVPVSVSWFGKEELKTLHRAEWLGGWAQPRQRNLFSAMYVNELILKLTAPEDPSPKLFDLQYKTLQALCTQPENAADLRHFEWQLLSELGFAPDYQRDDLGRAVQPENFYCVRPEAAVQVWQGSGNLPKDGVIVSGELLLQLGSGSLNAQSDLATTLKLTRLLLDFRLPDGIKSRRVLQQLNQFKNQFAA